MFSGSNRTQLLKNEPPIDNEPPEHQHHHQQHQRQQQQYLASEAAAALAARGEPAGSGQPTTANLNKSHSNNRRSSNGKSRHTPPSDSKSPESQQLLIQDKPPSNPSPNDRIGGSQKSATTNKKSAPGSSLRSRKKAKLAKEETIDEAPSGSRCTMVLRLLRRKRIFIPLIIVTYIVAIYCFPYVEIRPDVVAPLPHIPFNFQVGPLRPSSVSPIKVERLFQGQLRGAESVALDSAGNMYMAIEGGFILYAHLNKSSPIKRSYYYDLQQHPAGNLLYAGGRHGDPYSSSIMTTTMAPPSQQLPAGAANLPDLVKIAELNSIKQLPYSTGGGGGKRKARDGGGSSGSWRRECQLDEKIYGSSLYSGGNPPGAPVPVTPNEIDTGGSQSVEENSSRTSGFSTNVVVSRCSKPLGIRLSPDENYLYVVDTLSGLYRVSLQVPDKPHSTQRLVTRLVDFRNPNSQRLPVTQLDVPASQQKQQQAASGSAPMQVLHTRSYLDVTLRAVDDLTIDYGAGTRGGDVIYMSLASQNWIAIAYLYDLLEGRPSGAILRYDSGANELSVLDPSRVSHVRTSNVDLENVTSRLYTPYNESSELPFHGIGAPRLDENDEFDNRPLHFPNGLQLTDDRQAILIADTSNKRIIKHYIRGARRGTSDLWAWTPNFPDNIRRGYEKGRETYWVAGCGEDNSNKIDPMPWIRTWPMLRKFILKQIYLVGWMIEQLGIHLLRSTSVQDFGYNVRVGHSLLEKFFCPGMMLLQYNSHGDIIRSTHSKEFPNDLAYYSQVNEVIDAKNQEHSLYLSSPTYTYVTKLTLPTDSFDLPSANSIR